MVTIILIVAVAVMIYFARRGTQKLQDESFTATADALKKKSGQILKEAVRNQQRPQDAHRAFAKEAEKIIHSHCFHVHGSKEQTPVRELKALGTLKENLGKKLTRELLKPDASKVPVSPPDPDAKNKKDS